MGKVIPLTKKSEDAWHCQMLLHEFCTSLLDEKNRERFRAFPEGYCRQFKLSLEQIHAVTDLDIIQLLRLHLDLASLQQLTNVYGLDLQSLCLEQTGETLEEVIRSID